MPYWDFNAPGIPGAGAKATGGDIRDGTGSVPRDASAAANMDGTGSVPRDASAAAIMASGLYELCQYSHNAGEYRAAANTILKSLTDNYRSPLGTNKGFILLHSTGGKPSNTEVDVPINYADYYYLEALLRSQSSMKVTKK